MNILNSMSRRNLILLAALGSAGLFFGALFFQYVIGIEPCKMCFWQRWPHRIAIGLGIVGVFYARSIVAWAGGLTMLVSTGLAIYHTGVERHWWLGPTTCTSRGVDLSAASDCGLLDPNCGAPIVLCDQIAWDLFGLSMANYNAIISLVLMVIWVLAARRKA